MVQAIYKKDELVKRKLESLNLSMLCQQHIAHMTSRLGL